MTRILFVCHGNICRSPMAEFVMKDLVRKAGLEGNFEIASAATSREELGNPVYPPARRKLAERGIGCSGKTARQLERGDYAHYDLGSLVHRRFWGDLAGCRGRLPLPAGALSSVVVNTRKERHPVGCLSFLVQ